MFITPVEALANYEENPLSPQEMMTHISESSGAKEAVDWLLGEENEGEYLLAEKPALLSCIMLILLMLLPFLVCFGAFNQTSGDISNKGLRFLLLRTERVNIYLGRFIGTTLFNLMTVTASMVLLVLYIQFKLGIYDGVELWIWSIQGGIAYFILSLPFVAICAWMSSNIESPFGSLVLCLLIVGFPAILLKIMKSTANVDFLEKLWPTGWKFGMLNSSIGVVAMTCVVLLLFTVGFLWSNFCKKYYKEIW